MGGENSKEPQEQNNINEEDNKKENKKQKKIKKVNDEDEDNEEEEEEEDDDEEEEEKEEKKNEDKDTKKKNNVSSKNSEKGSSNNKENKISSKKSKEENTNNSKPKQKKNITKYFSMDESLSSKSKSDSKVSKSLNNNNLENISQISSYIDERKFNTNTSLNFSINSNSKNSKKNERDISEESTNPNYPKMMEKGRKKGDNKYYDILDKDLEFKKKEKKEEIESEIEMDMSLTLKERVYNEYNRHKYYLDSNEKEVYELINKKSFKNPSRYKYRKSVLLHKKEITHIISLSGSIKKISYATSSLDKTISLWDSSFLIIHNIKCVEWYSNFLCEFDTTNLLSCESNHIKIYDLMSEDYDCIKTFKDHIEDINCLLSMIDFDEEKYIFLSGGKDKILRLWDYEMNAPIKYYEGHYDTVTHIEQYGKDNKKFISCSNDKTFIVWDIKNANPLKIFKNYFNHLTIVGDSFGFCCGAFDNKIRFYNKEYLLIKSLVSDLYGIKNILMADDYCMLTVDINNNINVIDLDDNNNNLAFIYTGYEDEIVSVIKSFNWNFENKGSKSIIVACKNGYAYIYTFEYESNNKNKKKDNNQKNSTKNHKKKK